jgi:predicted transcriptional regulator
MSTRIDPELVEEIKELAARERRRPGQLIANLIEDALAARRALTGERRSVA